MKEHWRDVHHDYMGDVYRDHGHFEIQECWPLSDGDLLGYLRNREACKDLKTIVMLRCERRVERKRSRQTCFYISSLPNDAKQILKAVRGHWGIENGLH